MDRRHLLRSAAATAVGAPFASLALPGDAYAAGTYHVAVCEQAANEILIHPVNKPWTPANRIWRWSPPVAIDEEGKNTWRHLSDIRFRDTGAFGWVALVAASEGKVGIVDMPNEDPAGALLWSARPYGKPHAIERIPGIGAVVTASSGHSDRVNWPGFLTVYGPTDVHDPGSLRRVQEIRFQGAHGLWYDGSHLWALGTWTLAKYRVAGDHLDTRLELVWKHSWPERPYNGHSLDTDYGNSAYLLITGGGIVQRVHKATGLIQGWNPTGVGVKSYSRVASGNSFWVQASEQWWSKYVQFFDSTGKPSFRRQLEGYGRDARFYKARVSSVAFS
ncbi:hypothetical protein JJV70_16070 [Streptomyces sp. JJ66]|uniref:hypothetical protein n=1 Tax=Streptomyces sp. JJ66 TaxID=2803843 RepID=UPI001C5850AF|nr:hypothetical protein [Streptomyces sp. JJ66]MBW1603593.1 hypothetical protein [Streptomyces sp. JJ66]